MYQLVISTHESGRGTAVKLMVLSRADCIKTRLESTVDEGDFSPERIGSFADVSACNLQITVLPTYSNHSIYISIYISLFA